METAAGQFSLPEERPERLILISAGSGITARGLRSWSETEALIPGSKAYFPARFMSVKRTMVQLSLNRVSVLDLDNSVRFSRDTT